MQTKVNYHFLDVTSIEISSAFEKWLTEASAEYKKSLFLNYIFCSDEALLEINKKYLNHDYYTDIITFDLSTIPDRIESDIYISIERVQENSMSDGVSFDAELARVMSHGVFHLLGFGDKTEDEALKMRELENSAVKKITNCFT